MIPTNTLYHGFGQWLHDQGVAVYEPNGMYDPDTALPAVIVGDLPDTPNAVIGLTVYDENTSRGGRGTPDLYLQIRFRLPGLDPRPVDKVADNLSDILHDKSDITLPGGVPVLHAYRTIRGPTWKDDSGKRRERPDSYRLTLNPL